MTERFANSHEAGYERQDASPRGLFIFFACMGCTLLLICFLLVWLFHFFAKASKPAPFINQPFGNTRPLPIAPLLQPQPTLDIHEYMKSQQDVLQSYGWIDRQNGIAHIPIDQAMQLLLKRGLPTRPSQAAPAPSQSSGANAQSPVNSHEEVQQ